MNVIRVLLADADASLLSSYRTYLTQDGFEVATATSGLACVDQLRRFRPDVLILELDLPWGSGHGVLALMQDQTDVPLVPVIVLLATPGGADLPRSRCVPAREYQLKPLAPYLLAQQIRQLLDRARSGSLELAAEMPQPLA